MPLERDDNDTLMRRAALHNDTQAFGCLVRAHEMRVTRFALRLLNGDHAQAEDVAQEAFLRLWRTRATYTAQGTLLAFLFRITRNLCVDFQRAAHHAVPLEPSDATPGPLPDDAVRGISLADAIREAVAALPEAQRVVFVLSHYEGMSYEEIAHILDCPMGTVASRRHLAIQALRKKLAPWVEEEQ